MGREGYLSKYRVANSQGGSVKKVGFLAYVISEWPLTEKSLIKTGKTYKNFSFKLIL